MAEHNALRNRIESQLSLLSQGQKRLARFVLDNPSYVAFSSTRDVGEKAEVSAATIVRFCQALGYTGYTALQASIRDDLPSYAGLAGRFERRELPGHGHEDVLLGEVFETDRQNLDRTAAQVDLPYFREAVAALTRARAILVIGDGVSASPAMFFGHSLRILDYPVRTICNDPVASAVELAHLQTDDAVIGIGVWRYLEHTVSALRAAREREATRIVITDTPVSPLAALADYSFYVGTQAVSHSVSLVGMMALLDTFLAALSHLTPQRTAQVLRQVDATFVETEILAHE